MVDSNNPFNRNSHRNNPYQNPYQNLYDLPTSPQYLFDEEAADQRRSWSENLQFYTGCSYLTGAITGGTKGTLEGLMAAERGDSLKLRTTRVLNYGGHTRRRYGNSLGILGVMYGALESRIAHYVGTDDTVTTFLAGLGTGALYKVASGPRSAVVTGIIGGFVTGCCCWKMMFFGRKEKFQDCNNLQWIHFTVQRRRWYNIHACQCSISVVTF